RFCGRGCFPVYSLCRRMSSVPQRSSCRRQSLWNSTSGTLLSGGVAEVVRREMQSRRRGRENLTAGFGNADGVLELRREFAIARHGRPSVGQNFHVRLPEVDHRLDREQHTGFEQDALAWLAVVQNVVSVVETRPEAGAAKVTHDSAALALGVLLNCRADVAGRVARLHRSNAA